MTRSLQLQVLTWLAALSVLGAMGKSTVDTWLFAAAFALGTVLLRVREGWKHAELAGKRDSLWGQSLTPEVRDLRALGESLGALLAWGAALARMHWPHVVHVPERLGVGTLVMAAIVPTLALLMRVVDTLRSRARRAARRRELDLE